MDGVVEPPRKEVLALPLPSSPGTPPPPPPAAEAQSPVTPASVAIGTEQAMNGGEVDREEWITVSGSDSIQMLHSLQRPLSKITARPRLSVCLFR